MYNSTKKPSINRTMRQLVSLIAIVLSMITFTSTVQATETITYYHNDLLGSPIAMTNESGQVIWKETYKPYGERVINDPESADNTLWYTGKAHDDETGLSYFGARYYDPVIGRFMAVDPVGFQTSNPTSFNRYAYANNNPYRYVDPDGELPIFLLAFAAYDFYNAYQETGSIGQAAGAAALGVINPFGKLAKAAKVAKVAGKAAKSGGTETVQRWMSKAELKVTQETGLIRGGRDGVHYVTDAANSSAKRARQRTSLDTTPEVRVTMDVPAGTFSSPTKVLPKHRMPGGGSERTATGKISATIRKVNGKP